MLSENIIEFLNFLGDYIRGCKSQYSIDDTILTYAQNHGVEGIIYKQTQDQRLRPQYLYAIYAYSLRKKLLQQIEELLDDYYVVKGPIIAQYYPDPSLRTMGDIDIIVPGEYKQTAKSILISNGFVLERGDGAGDWKFNKDGLRLELHHDLLYGEEAGETVNDAYIPYFKEYWQYVENHRLRPENHFIYLLIHLRKHIMNKGIGLRQFMDLALFSRQSLDWDYLTGELKRINADLFAGRVFGLIKRWWDIECPLTVPITDAFYEKATEMILSDGVFGDSNEMARANSLINKFTHGKGFSYLLKIIFPSYKMFVKYKYQGCSFVIGHPLLTPIGWIVHAVVSLYKTATDRKYFKSKIPDRAMITARNAYLEEWGL